jgi:hypothetical protein
VQLDAAKFVQPPNQQLELGQITLTLIWALNSHFLDQFLFWPVWAMKKNSSSPNRMAKNKKEAAARARAGRARSRASIAVAAVAAAQIPQLPDADIAPEMQIFIGDETDAFESDRDCGYTRGVNCSPDSDSEHSGTSWSDTETLAELDGAELEENLQMLLAEELQDLEGLANASKYSQIAAPKSDKVWKKSEKNRALGYTGSSQRTRQRNDKASRDRADLHKKAQTSWVIFSVLSALINNLCFSVMIHRFP